MENNYPPLPAAALHPLPEDARDFKLGAVQKPVPLTDIPDEFYDAEIIAIKDQGQLDFCAGYAGAAVSEDQEAVELDPHYPFMAAKRRIGGNAWTSWGLNLRDLCEAAIRDGFIEATAFPFVNDDRAGDRDFLANPENWPKDVDLLAEEHKKGSYWNAGDGPYDTFDNIRSAIWGNRFEHRSVLTGALFRPEWGAAQGGVIPKTYGPTGEGHAFKIFGWKTIDGEPYLVIQNSWGRNYGDDGLFYMPREVANKELTFGNYTFKDISVEDAKVIIDTGITPADALFAKAMKVLWYWIKSVLHLK